MKIRSATVVDSDSIADLLKSIGGVWQPTWRSDCVHRAISAADGLVFVAVDEHGRRQKVPAVLPETPNEVRRYNDAMLRREHRESEAARRKQERRSAGLTRV